MIDGFTTRNHRIMTTNAAGGNRRMIDSGAQPTGNNVTNIAGFRCLHVINSLATRDYIVVTTRAGADNLRMIDAIGRDRFP